MNILLLLPGITNVHWPLTDPAKATGSEYEFLDEFGATRNEVERRGRGLPDTVREGDAQ